MHRLTSVVALGLVLANAAPVAAQAPDPSRLLGGLLSGNQGQDQAVRDAFERGYQRGRQDQERADNDRRGPPVQRGYPNQNGRDPQGYQPPGQVPYGR